MLHTSHHKSKVTICLFSMLRSHVVVTDDATRQVVKVRQHVAGLSLRAGRSKEGGDHA